MPASSPTPPGAIAPQASPRGASDRPRPLRALLKRRVRMIETTLRRCRRQDHATPQDVHRLRVLTRRCGAILRASDSEHQTTQALRLALRTLRRKAAAVRDADVALAVLQHIRRAAPVHTTPALDALIDRLQSERRAQLQTLAKCWRRGWIGKLHDRAEVCLPHLDELHSPSSDVLDKLRKRVLADAANDLSNIQALHRLRISLKRLRYLLELDVATPSDARLAILRTLQEHFGEVHDADALACRLEREALKSGEPSDETITRGIRQLADRYRRLCLARHNRFMQWWNTQGSAMLYDAVRDTDHPHDPMSYPPLHSSHRNGASHTTVAPTHPTADDVIPPAPAETVSLFPSIRLAAIDVGSNSIRLLVAEALPDGRLRIIDDEKETTRLAAGLSSGVALAQQAMDQSVEVITRMAGIARGYGAHNIRAIATSAVRDAENGTLFADRIRQATGIDLEVISAEEEARLAFRSASEAFDLSEAPAAVVDIGGGSVQIILTARNAIEQLYPLRLGAVRMTERFGGPKSASRKRRAELRKFVRATLKDQVGPLPLRPRLMIGTGGTFSTLALLARHMESPGRIDDRAPLRVQGLRISRETVLRLIDRLADLPLAARARAPGMPPDRADIIVPGLIVAERIMKHLDVHEVVVHQGGIRAGLLRMMADQALGRDAAPRSRGPGSVMDAVRRFAHSLAYERDHSEHVTMLALSIFDQLASHGHRTDWMTDEARLLLEAAAVLHDIGYAIGYARHHKHSEQIIAHSDLPGLTSRQIELIALIARFHRRAEPRRSHPALAPLTPPDRRLVRRLAAILRVADGLDRAHSRTIESVRLTFTQTAVVFNLSARGDPTTDIWGAHRKGLFFETAFKRSIEFRVNTLDT
ncbi:MAG: CHAD domain-containing protein [Phycisphaeraceae bacterium]|nr:CHAD domain-containing protein [Phycisphaeraceae bacterium]